MTTGNWVGGGDVRITAEGQQTAPAVAALAGGGYVIGWLVTGTSALGAFSEVHAQRFDAAGAKLGGELLLSQGPAYDVPALAALADGGFVASWDARSAPFANTNYLVRHFDANGNPLGDAVQANLPSNPDNAPSVEATALTGGGFLVDWWMNPGGPTFWGPQMQLYAASGAPIGGDTPLGYEADGTPYGDATYLHGAALAPTADGGFVAVWAAATAYQPGVGNADRIYLQKFDAVGNALAAPAQALAVPSGTAAIDGVEVATLAGSGDVVISTRGPLADGRMQITAQRFDSAGHALGAQQAIVFANAVLDSKVTALAGGDFVVSWIDSQVQSPSLLQLQTVYSQGFDSQGNLSGSQVQVGSSQALNSHYTVTATADGGAVFAWDDGRADGADVYAEHFVPSQAADVTAPTVVAFSPADEAMNVPVTSNIVVSFSETIQRGSGSIVLKDAAGNVVAAYDAASSGNLGISGATLTINPSADLAPATGYSVQFAAGTLRDASGNAYAGTSSYNFTTAGTGPVGDTVAPTVTDFFPGPGTNTLSPDWSLGITFSEAVKAGSGTITLQTAAGAVVQTFTPGDPGLHFNGTSLVIDPAADLMPGTTYRLIVAPDAVKDLAGNAYAGETGYTFGTAGTAPAPGPAGTGPAAIDFYPGPGNALPPDWNLGMTFSESVKAGAGTITLQTAAGAVVQTFSANDPGLHFSGATLIIDPAANLQPGTSYRLIVGRDAVESLAGSAYAGDSGHTFGTSGTAPAPGPAGTGPAAIDFFPAAGSKTLAPDWSLGITFSENIKAGSGTVTLQTAAGAVVQSFAPGDPGLHFNGASLIIDPAADLQPGTAYRLVVAPDAVENMAGTAYAGESGYGFSTSGTAPAPGPGPAPGTDTRAPTPTDFFPGPGSNTLPPDWSLGITFSEGVKAGAGSITLQTAAGVLVQNFAAGDPGIHFDGASVIIDPAADLQPGTTYRLIVGPDAVEDLAGNAYAGESDYTFTTAGNQVIKAALLGVATDVTGFIS